MSHDLPIDLVGSIATSYDPFRANQDAGEVTGGVSMWEKAHDQILAIARLDADWDGDGSDSVRPEIVQSASRLLRRVRTLGYSVPQDIYPMPDGTITLEWQNPGDVIIRIEVEGAGRGTQMTTYPDAPTEFKPCKWPPAGPLGVSHHLHQLLADEGVEGLPPGEFGQPITFPCSRSRGTCRAP